MHYWVDCMQIYLTILYPGFKILWNFNLCTHLQIIGKLCFTRECWILNSPLQEKEKQTGVLQKHLNHAYRH